MFAPNRIADAINVAKPAFEKLDAAKVAKISAAATLDMEAYVLFQEMKSLAVSEGKLTLEEGQTVYAYLGNIPDTFNKQPLHIRYALYVLYSAMLKARMAARRG